MDNPFDQFDEPNPFDRFDEPQVSTPEQRATLSAQPSRVENATVPAQSRQQDHGLANPLLEFAAAVNRGVIGIPDLPADIFNWISSKAGSDIRAARIGDIDAVREATTGNYMDPGLAKDVVSSAGEFIPGAVSAGASLRTVARQLPEMGRASESAGRGVLRQLGATTPGQDLRMAAAAGAGMEFGGEVGETIGGETGRQVGEIAGSMATPAALSLTHTGIYEAVKSILRGGTSRQAIRSTVDDFKETGTTPTVAQATGRPLQQGVENISSQYIGGGRIRRAHEDAERNIRRRLQEIADDVSIDAGVDRAGRTIQRGITAPGGFVDRFQAKSADLWSRVDEQIGRDTAVDLINTKSALNRLVRDDEFSNVLNNPQLAKIKQVLEDADLVDYQTLKELRSTIGRRVSGNDLISDIPRAELKQLYGAITDDIKIAADAAGPRGRFSFNRANNFTRSGHKRLDDFVERIANKVDLDKVFTAATKGGEGLGTINAMKRSLTKDEWNTVVSNVIRQMGRATAGQQDAAGEVFSVNKFLTDWNRLGPAKAALFSGTEVLNRYGKNLDRIARQAEKMKFSQKEAANPSGTGQFAANLGTTAGIPIAAATGQQGVMYGLLMSVAMNNLGARLMTNKRFVNWLAEGMELSPAVQPEHMAKLLGITRGMTLDEATAVNAVLAEMSSQDMTNAESPRASDNRNHRW